MGLVCLQHHPQIGVEDIRLGPHSVEVRVAGVAVLAHHGQANTGEVGQGPGLVAGQVTPGGVSSKPGLISQRYFFTLKFHLQAMG